MITLEQRIILDVLVGIERTLKSMHEMAKVVGDDTDKFMMEAYVESMRLRMDIGRVRGKLYKLCASNQESGVDS